MIFRDVDKDRLGPWGSLVQRPVATQYTFGNESRTRWTFFRHPKSVGL